jgi:MoxR-like ATPase
MADPHAACRRNRSAGAAPGQAKASINRRFIGQEKVVDLVLAALLCGGHALLVGLPGWARRGWSTRCPP